MNEEKSDRLSFASPTFGTQFERTPTPGASTDHEPEPKKSKFRRWFKRSLLILVALVVLLVLVFGWQFYSTASKLTGQKNPIALIADILPRSLAESNGRANILLAGYSVGDPHHQGAALTDSIMIVSINPKNKTATLISVPRDLWVNIPGNGYAKINAAYEDGAADNFNQPGYFPGGMGLLEEVVSRHFGISFNYYALINYAAFRDAVNAVGGITVDIKSTDPRGLYDAYTHLKLPNGEDKLNGQEALDLARARGDESAGDVSYGFGGSDFERTQHQQEMLVAVAAKASKLSSILDPLTVLRLASAVGDNVKTNLNLGQMETLYRDTRGVSNKKIKQVTLNSYNGQDLLTNYYVDGQDALIPAAGFDNYSAIQNAVQQLLYGQ